MKKLLLTFLLFSTIVIGQAPNKMSFQTVVRNNLGELVVNKIIGVRLSILQSTSSGSVVYVETHSKTSNVNGLLNIEVGTGTVSSGTFATINWSQGPYFLKTEMDVNGGTNYSISGVTEFVSVPYALNATIADSIKMLNKGENIGDMNYWNGTTWVPLNAGEEGQTLTFCNGKPTWTIGGVCPGTITALNCTSITNNGTLSATYTANEVTSIFTYTGGNGGFYKGQVVNSTGVTGLTATLQEGRFNKGDGSLIYIITGAPVTIGTAIFSLNIIGKTCILSRTVNNASSKPTSGYGSIITDLEGNTYKTVYIGTQQWMAENLKASKYNDGTVLYNGSTETVWRGLTSGAWVYYNNDIWNNAKYGKLYNWYAVSKTTNGNKNICPTNWHVPTDAEWTVLIDYLGGASVAGGKMKETGTNNWLGQNTDASNVSLFTGLPGGHRLIDASYSSFGYNGSWWSSTEGPANGALYRTLGNDNINASRGNYNKQNGFSVRCLKD